MMDNAGFACPDPLLHSFPLPLRETFFALGFPLEIATNDARVLDAARGSFGDFRKRIDAGPIRIYLGVQPGENGIPPVTTFRARNHLLSIVCDAGNFAICDLDAGFAYGWVSSAVAGNSDWLRHRFLDTLVFSCLAQTRVTPVHAACVSRNGRGLLLCAPSGTGKTTLAYACARQGWTYLGDDAVYLLRDSPEPVILGKPHSLRFVDSAVSLFPELRGYPTVRDPNGELRIELHTPELPDFAIAEQCLAHRVVFLDRTAGGSADLSALAREEALRRLLADLPRFQERVFDEHRRSLETLVETEAYLLTYSDCSSAFPLLDSLLE